MLSKASKATFVTKNQKSHSHLSKKKITLIPTKNRFKKKPGPVKVLKFAVFAMKVAHASQKYRAKSAVAVASKLAMPILSRAKVKKAVSRPARPKIRTRNTTVMHRPTIPALRPRAAIRPALPALMASAKLCRPKFHLTRSMTKRLK